MALPISRIIHAAVRRGLTPTTPISLTVEGVDAKRINVIVAHSEPVNVTAPLQVIWIHPDSAEVWRRVSRVELAPNQHSWEDATEETFWLEQVWDIPRPANQDFLELNRMVGNPFDLNGEDFDALTTAGGVLEGPLHARPENVEEPFAETEVVPLSFTKKLIKVAHDAATAAQNLSASVYQQLSSIRTQLNAVRNRVTNVERELEEIEAGAGAPQYFHTQEEPATSWVIEHGFIDMKQIAVVDITKDDGTKMIPDTIVRAEGDGSLTLTFAEPRMGTAALLGIR